MSSYEYPAYLLNNDKQVIILQGKYASAISLGYV